MNSDIKIQKNVPTRQLVTHILSQAIHKHTLTTSTEMEEVVDMVLVDHRLEEVSFNEEKDEKVFFRFPSCLEKMTLFRNTR